MNQTAVIAPSHTTQKLSTIFFILALVAAGFLRFYLLSIKPFHHDEGVNSFFLLNLINNGEYKYDPTNYHGPSLYYFVWLCVKVLGQTDFALRFYPALCGVLTVALLWWLRAGLGPIGTPVAAWSLALSPGLVYFSRDFIHESSFGLFSVGLIVTAYHWRKRYSPFCFGIFAALLYTTKETAIHTTLVFMLSVLCAIGWDWIRSHFQGRPRVFAAFEWVAAVRFLALATGVFVPIYIVLYTSFFTNANGPLDYFRSVFMWTGRGVSEHIHDHAVHYYVGILFKLELPLLVAAGVGALLTLWRGSRFGLFVFAWSYGMVLGYSLIPYKTPWLMVSMLIALAVFAGYAGQLIFDVMPNISLQRLVVLFLLAVAVPIAWMSWRVNFQAYDDNENRTAYFATQGRQRGLRPYVDTQYGYVYAQTDRDLLNLVAAIEQTQPVSIHIASPDYWPLPWYLRAYNIVSYEKEVPDDFQDAALIASAEQALLLRQKLSAAYRAQEFTLRPGVNLTLLLRK